MSFHRGFLSALACLTPLAVAASGAAAASPAEISACALIMPSEVATVLGTAMIAAEQAPMGGGEGRGRMTACFWSPEAGRLGPTLSLMVWSWPPGSAGATGYVEAFRTAAAEHPDLPAPEPLAIADEALWDGTGVHVRKGDVSFSLGTSLNALDATPDARDKLEALANLVASRL
jgi:hypothetical protein